MQVAFLCCFRQGVAGMSQDLSRDVRYGRTLFGVKFPGLLLAQELCRKTHILGANLKGGQ